MSVARSTGRGRINDSRTLYGWLKDGTLIYGASANTAALDLWRASSGTNATATPVVATPFVEGFGAVSQMAAGWLTRRTKRVDSRSTRRPTHSLSQVADFSGWRSTARVARGRQRAVLSGAPRAIDGGPHQEAVPHWSGAPQRLFQTALSRSGIQTILATITRSHRTAGVF